MAQEVAIFGSLFNAFLWGSWAVVLKKLDGYPLDAFFLALYIVAFSFVWILALTVRGEDLFREIAQVWRNRPAVIAVALGAGAAYIVGMRIMLTVYSAVGLSVTAPISTFMSLIMGTLLAALVGGTPVALAPLDLSFACLLFFAAAMAVVWARICRDRSLFEAAGPELRDAAAAKSRRLLKRNILLVAPASAIINAYPLGLAFCLRTPSHSDGLSPMPFMAILVTGSLFGASLLSGAIMTARRQWPLFIRAKWNVQQYAVIAAGGHYGGNIINAFATGTLTAAVSWPLGTTSQLWTYVWGLATGEFKGAPRKSYLLIAAGAALYLAGIVYLRWALTRSA